MKLLQPVAARSTLSLPESSSIYLHFKESKTYQCHRTCEVRLNRRCLTISVFPFIIIPISPSAANEVPNLDVYTDSSEGFTLVIPSSFSKVEKAGATALFEDGKGNNIGVVVTPVKLSSLSDFGTPQFVADKLIQAERRKESTKEANLVAVGERSGDGGLPVYEFEYIVDSTRGGLKRIFSAAFVASKKLFLLNIACKDTPDNPLAEVDDELLEY